MWIDVKCPLCNNGLVSGLSLIKQRLQESGEENVIYEGNAEAPEGDYGEAFFPCERCNGEGHEAKWLQDCEKCGTTGLIQTPYGEEICPRCRGLGGYERGMRKTSRFKKVEGSWTNSNDVINP